MIGEEATTIFFGKDSGKAPFITLKCTHFENINNQNVSWLCAVHPNGSAEDVNHLQVHIFNVFWIIIIFDLAIRPVFAFNPEGVARIHRCHGWNVWVPSVMARHFLLIHWLGQINIEKRFGHEKALPVFIQSTFADQTAISNTSWR